MGQTNTTITSKQYKKNSTHNNQKCEEEEQKLNLGTLVFIQTIVVMIGEMCWSIGIGLDSALSKYVSQQLLR